MIIDSSALVAILLREVDARMFAEAINAADIRRMSAANWFEASIVVDTKGDPIARRRLDDLIRTASIALEPVSIEQAQIARAAYRDFGRGSGHPAHLNFGDCFAYALAKLLDEPLLFKGSDFSYTDVRSAI